MWTRERVGEQKALEALSCFTQGREPPATLGTAGFPWHPFLSSARKSVGGSRANFSPNFMVPCTSGGKKFPAVAFLFRPENTPSGIESPLESVMVTADPDH